MTAILVPGVTCAEVFAGGEGGLLIDGRDYYRAVYDTARRARRSILIAAWQLDTTVPLLHGEDAAGAPTPVELLPMLTALCEARPELEVRILAWDPSSLFLLERELLQARAFAAAGHPRIRVAFDDSHPIGASHHQKLIVVDRAVAFLGGMDVCASRWDDRGHAAEDPRRRARLGLHYGPYHDVQAFVTGPPVDRLIAWFAERWHGAGDTPLDLPDAPRDPIGFEPTVRVAAPAVGLARTLPRQHAVRETAIEELRALHVAAIAAARESIYIENQYFSSHAIRAALLDRMAADGPPLDIVLILPERTKALRERVSIGIRQAALLLELAAAAAQTGHRFGAYYTAAPRAGGGERPVYIHAKVLAVDDRFLLVSSANTSNRSMGLDSELGVAWEAPLATASLRAARVELLREHTGLGADAARVLHSPHHLVTRLDDLARAGTGRLRRHPMDEADSLLGRMLPDGLVLDPDGPVLDDALWEATDGGGEVHLVERLRAAWRRLRDGLAPA